jgi:Rad3-related DNA helicase
MFTEWSGLADNLHRLKNSNDYWAVKSTRNGYYMEPLIAADYAEEYLWRDSKRILLTSATLNLKTVEMLGIPADEYHYRNYSSDFPVVNCRLIHVPTVSVKHSMSGSDRQKWLDRHTEIIAGRLDRKGIIHTKSYERANEIFRNSPYRDRMILHEPGAAAQAVEAFKGMQEPCILVSPAVGTGYDFPGDQCRYQIISKIPFTDSRDPILQAREKYDPEYGLYLMAQELVQMSSRGNRSKLDWCENFVIDDLVRFAIFHHKHLFPNYYPGLYFRSVDRSGQGVVPPARPLDGSLPTNDRSGAYRVRQTYSVTY